MHTSLREPSAARTDRGWILALGTGFAVLIWTALVSAQLGRFSAPAALMAGAAAVAVARVAWRRRGGGMHALPLRRIDALALATALATLALTWPAGELVLGGWDPGVYVHTAAQVNQHGALQFPHADIAEVPPEDRALLFRDLGGMIEPFGGMRLLPNGRISPTFYHLYPAVQAFAMRWGGLRAALAVNPILNVAALLAFYALLTALFHDRRWAWAGLVALAVQPAQIWQARFGTAEMLTQLLITGGFALLIRWDRNPSGRTWEAALGGAALGLAQLARYDTLILLAVAVPVLVLRAADPPRRRGLAAALALLGLLALHAWAHQAWIAPLYRPLGPLVAGFLLAVLLLFAMACAVLAWPRGRRWATAAGPWAALATSAAWLGWMAFNGGLRPTLHARTRLRAPMEALSRRLGLSDGFDILIGPDSRAMLYLRSVFGILALVLAIAGILVLLWKPGRGFVAPESERKGRHAPVLAWFWGGMAVTLVLTWRPFNELFMMWVVRRYTPTVVPWLLTGLMAGVVFLHARLRGLRRGRSLAPLAPLLLAFALACQIPATRHMARMRDWPGLTGWFEEVARTLPQDKAVFTDQPHFGAPLRFLWQHRAFELQHPNPERIRAFHELLERAARREGGSVLFLTQNPPPAETSSLAWDVIREFPLHSHIMVQPRHEIPWKTQPRGGDFVLYRLRVDPYP